MAATATLYSQVYDTIWTVLDADANLSAFMGDGKKFRHNDFSDTPTIQRPDDCPALSIAPAKIAFSVPNNKEQLWPFTLKFQLSDHREDWRYAAAFYARVMCALMSSLYNNMGLSYLRLWTFTEASMEPGFFGEGGERWAAWVIEFSLTVQLYRDARSSGLFTVDA